MTTLTWRGGNGDWSASANWNPSKVPTSTDDAVIGVTGAITITRPSAARSLTLSSGQASVNLSSALTLASGGPGLSISAGAFSVQVNGILRTSGGAVVLGAGASFTTAGLVALGSGTFSDDGALHLLNRGVVQGSISVGQSGSVLADSGSALGLRLSTILGAEQGKTGSITIASGARLTVTTDNTTPLTTAQLLADLGSAGKFSNATVATLAVATSIDNSGNTLTVTAAGPRFDVLATGSLSGGNLVLRSGTFTDAGTLSLSGGNLVVAGGTLLDQGRVVLNGGTDTVTAGALIDDGILALQNATTLSVSGGTFGGTGTVAGGTLARTGGQLVASGLTLRSVAYRGALSLAGSDSLSLTGGTTLATSTGGAEIVTLAGGSVLTADAATTLAGTTININGGTLVAAELSPTTVVNLTTGTVEVGTLDAGSVLNQFGGLGTVGKLEGNGGALVAGGTINAAASGTTLELLGTVSNKGTIDVSSRATVLVANGSLVNGSAIELNQGTLNVPSGTRTSNSALFNNAGTISLTSGSILSAYFGTNAATISVDASSFLTVGSTFLAGTTGSAGGSVQADPNANVTVVTNVTETLASFQADQSAVRADLGRTSYNLQLGGDLNLAVNQTLFIASASSVTSSLTVNYTLVPQGLSSAYGIIGGNTFVGAGGALTLDQGNIYSAPGNAATVSLVDNGILTANGTDTIVGSVFNQSSSAGLFVNGGSSLTISGALLLGQAQAGGGTVGVATVSAGASLTVNDTSYVSNSADGVYFLGSGANLYLDGYADLKNQSVSFEKGSTGDIVHLNDGPALGLGQLQGSLFGFAASDQVILPFSIGSLSYDGNTGFLAISDASGHSAGADFFVGTGYNPSLFAGQGSSTLAYNGAPPAIAAVSHHFG